MTCELIHRALIDPLRHANVDAELKQLKLASRRLHQTLTVLAAEQQLLQRLYYKSKNQHRGALFWRNVGEILRYLRKLDVPDLQESVAKLRNTFYGSTVGWVSVEITLKDALYLYLLKLKRHERVLDTLSNSKLSYSLFKSVQNCHAITRQSL